ncbi:hypothetical protein ACIPQA_16525 [Streptomyces sp. NPDC090109]|uniref:hypothetical protein n=1 Tax=Streptomyces sp. NPDC090109 TaxID=3365948 RepID=UPI003803FF97
MPDPIVYSGQTVKAATINDLVAPHVQVSVGAFAVPTGASTYTAVVFNTQLSGNTLSMWGAGAPTRLVAPTAGIYLVHGGITWPASLGAADARGEVRANGSASPSPGIRVGTQRGSAGNMQVAAVGTVVLAAGGYIELYLNTQSGSVITSTATLGITRVSLT